MSMQASRAPRPIPPQQAQIGDKLKAYREQNGLTLEAVSRVTGVSIATLWKLENGKAQVKFETLTRLFNTLGVNLAGLPPSPDVPNPEKLVVNRLGDAVPVESQTYRYDMLSAGLTGKAMAPIEMLIKARSIEDFPSWNQHSGEEFIYVLSGRVKLYLELREPIFLEPGESAHYDSSIKHAIASVGDEDARILSISTGIPPIEP